MSKVFVDAAVILLREGLEAMLVIAALAAYLRKVHATHRVAALYGGALLAIVASAIGAWIFAVFYNGEHNDLLEGIVMLAAATLMLYVSGWLLVRQDPRAWQDYLSQKADDALAQGTGWAVALLAFLAVFREGAETILFINALAGTDGGWTANLFGGLAAAALALVVLFYFINVLAQRIPLRPLFVITSAFLFVMAIKFIGQAVQEFQEQQLITTDEVRFKAWIEPLGFNPSVEALTIQLLVVVFALTTYSLMSRNARLAREAAAARHAAAE